MCDGADGVETQAEPISVGGAADEPVKADTPLLVPLISWRTRSAVRLMFFSRMPRIARCAFLTVFFSSPLSRSFWGFDVRIFRLFGFQSFCLALSRVVT